MSYLDHNEILILRVLLNIRLCTKNLCINKCDMVMRRKSLTGAKNWYQRCIKLSAMEKNAWISYDTLYIDGRPVRSEH